MKAKIISIAWTLLRVVAILWIIGGIVRLILGGLVIYAGEMYAGGLAVVSGVVVIAMGVLGIKLCDRRDAKRKAEG